MSGRRSPYQEGGSDISTIPEGTYINPDTIPEADISMDREPDHLDVAPTRGNKAKMKLKKVGNLFKKKTHDEPKPTYNSGALQLGDVMGKTAASSMMSETSGRSSLQKPEFRDSPATVQSVSSAQSSDILRKKPPRMSFHGSVDYGDPGQPGRMDSMRTGIRNFFHGPPAPSPPMSPDAETELAPMKAPPPKSPCRASISLMIVFGLIISVGSIMLVGGMIGDTRSSEHCRVLAPCLLGLGIFGLIGEIYFMLWWKADPLPMLNNCMKKINEKIGGIEDPYGLKLPPTNQRSSYYPGLRLSHFSPGPSSLPPAYNQYSPGPSSPPPAYPYSPTTEQAIPLTTWKKSSQSSPGPLGPAAFGGGPAGPGTLASQPSWRPPSSYEGSSVDDSFDTKPRNGASPAPAPAMSDRSSYHNSSYQRGDEELYAPGRII